MDRPLISVIVPTYNVVNYLEKCVVSICQQTYPELEIIIVDDGATDGSGKLADTISQRDSRIRVLHKTNGGLSSARNAGLETAKGDYFMFIDSDDFIDEKMCETLITNAILDNSQIVECGHKKLFINNEKVEAPCETKTIMTGREATIAYLERSKPIQSAACFACYHRSIFKDLRFVEGRLHEDGWFKFEALYYAHKVTLIPDVLYYYVQERPGSIMTSTIRKKNVIDVLDAFEYRWHFFEKQEDDELAELSKFVYVKNLLSYYYIVIKRVSDKNDAKELRKMLKDKLFDYKSFVMNSPLAKGIRIKFFCFYYFRTFTVLLNKIR